MHAPPTRRRGITLIETSVACFLSILLIDLVARSWIGFTRGARLVAARAELVREADVAIAHMAGHLRGGEWPEADPVDGSLRLGGHVCRANGVLTCDCDGQVVAWHVAALTLSNDRKQILLTMTLPRVYKVKGQARDLTRTVPFVIAGNPP